MLDQVLVEELVLDGDAGAEEADGGAGEPSLATANNPEHLEGGGGKCGDKCGAP